MIFLGILIGIVVTFVFLQLIKVISRVCSIISARKEREQCRYENMSDDIRDLKERVDKIEIKCDGYDRDVVCGKVTWLDQIEDEIEGVKEDIQTIKKFMKLGN